MSRSNRRPCISVAMQASTIGGGPQISAMLDKAGVKSSFVDGLRVTDPATMEVAEMVLSGAVNKEITHVKDRHHTGDPPLSGGACAH